MRALVLVCLLAGVAHAKPKLEDGRSIVLLVDRALAEADLAIVRSAIEEVDLRDDDAWSVVTYAKKAQILISLRGGKARTRVISTTEPTNLVAGLELTHKMLRKMGRRTQLVIVVTNAKDVAADEAIAKLSADGITISAIGVGDNKRAVAAIAKAGKGRKYVTRDVATVAAALQREVDLRGETHGYVFLIDESLYGGPLERAKEEARTRAEALAPDDMVAVIAFGAAADVYVRPQRAANRMRISHEISRIRSGTGADTALAMRKAAELLSSILVAEEHVVLFGTGDRADLAHVNELAASGVTISAVGFHDRHRDQLDAIAKAGDGTLQMIGSIDLRMR